MQNLDPLYIQQQDNLFLIATVTKDSISCPKCCSDKCKKNGIEHRQYGKVQRYKCNECRSVEC